MLIIYHVELYLCQYCIAFSDKKISFWAYNYSTFISSLDLFCDCWTLYHQCIPWWCMLTCIFLTRFTGVFWSPCHAQVLHLLKAIEAEASIWNHATDCCCETSIQCTHTTFLQEERCWWISYYGDCGVKM